MGSRAREGSTDELLNAQTRVLNYAFGYIKSMSAMVAVQLGIPNAVHAHGGPIPLRALASAVGVPDDKVPALRRLMRALSCFGVFETTFVKAGSEEAYLLTFFSRQLASNSPTTGAPFFLHAVDPVWVTPWYSMAVWFRGEGAEAATGFETAHGNTLVGLFSGDPGFYAMLDGALAADSKWAVGVAARKHPEVFRGLGSLVDVGGGCGVSAKAIKDVFPEMRCTVLDLPHVVASSPAVDGVDFLAGNMFEYIPPADGVLLKWVLLNYDDGDCVRILRRCKEAVPARELGGKVIIIEIVLGGDGGGSTSDGDHRELVEAQHLFDLHMLMSNDGGQERDEGEWRRIFAAAGFSGCKITPALGPRSIIEVYP